MILDLIKTEEFENMMAGIIDPVKVVSCFQYLNSSIAGMLAY